MKHRTVIAICLLIMALAVIASCTGCAYGHVIAGQGADLATSAYGMDNGCSEGGISGNSLLTLAGIKVGVCGLVYWLDDDRLNAFAAGAGYGAAGWNLTQIERARR